MKCVLATQNTHKMQEFALLLGPEWELLSLRDIGLCALPPETGTTFVENAVIKAEAVTLACGLAALADDSGLCVDALNGAPGVYSARYSHTGTDAANRQKLLEALRGVPPQKRGAYFACALALSRPGHPTLTVEGRTHGHITTTEQGQNGFGYDPLFLPRESPLPGATFAQLTQAQKGAISHRGRAVEALLAAGGVPL